MYTHRPRSTAWLAVARAIPWLTALLALVASGCNNEATRPVDRTAPSAVSDLTASSPTQTSVQLVWTAPGDDAAAGTASEYDVRYSTSPITDESWASAAQASGEPAPHAAGVTEHFTAGGLQSGTHYYFALKTADEVPNWSPLSNVEPVGTLPADVTPPDSVVLEFADATETTVTLTWSAPGDDGNAGTAAAYDLRYAAEPITPDTWNAATVVTSLPAPLPAGRVEVFTVTGLAIGTTYYFALKSADEVPNWSRLSNVLEAATVGPPDTIPPANVTDLAAGSPTVNAVTLTWTAPGDDGDVGTALAFDVRFSTSPIADSTWASATRLTGEPIPEAAGTPEVFVASGLQPGTHYYFALKTADEMPNWSGLSNVAEATTGTLPEPRGLPRQR